ncbi:MAG: class I SAM-dependent methyltransferase [Bacteroidota bacterium]
MSSTVETTKIDAIVEALFAKNGPDEQEYEQVLRWIDDIKPEEVELFREKMKPILNPGTIIGFSFTKPFGYNGDFFIIEKIYQRYISPDQKYKKWDTFFHTFPAAIAVVNRKRLAIDVLLDLNDRSDGQDKNVLILGSGPVTEVHEYFLGADENHLQFDLLDLDKRAISYAKSKHKANLHCMNFHNHNVIRYVPEKKYDLIWSAGLFDYFKDKHFVYLLKKYYAYVKEGGEMIIGNFNVENPSRKIMEVLGDWFLYHRSEEELVKFAIQAGIPRDKAEVITEPLGINLFLKVKK